jgi:hypothetical protein
MSDLETRLLARAELLADVSDLAGIVTGILGRARRAGLDPGALGGLTGAALALGEDGQTIYMAGSERGRGRAGGFADEREFASAVVDAEDDIAERLREALRLRSQVLAARFAARLALIAAYAMPARTAAERQARAEAIDAAKERLALCAAALEILRMLTAQLRRALARLRAVPSDLGETYESVYNLIRRSGHAAMPYDGEWITGGTEQERTG